jgi:hypothetical protein
MWTLYSPPAQSVPTKTCSRHLSLIATSRERSSRTFAAGNAGLPLHKVCGVVFIFHRPRKEPWRMILSPVLTLFREATNRDTAHSTL